MVLCSSYYCCFCYQVIVAVVAFTIADIGVDAVTVVVAIAVVGVVVVTV